MYKNFSSLAFFGPELWSSVFSQLHFNEKSAARLYHRHYLVYDGYIDIFWKMANADHLVYNYYRRTLCSPTVDVCVQTYQRHWVVNLELRHGTTNWLWRMRPSRHATLCIVLEILLSAKDWGFVSQKRAQNKVLLNPSQPKRERLARPNVALYVKRMIDWLIGTTETKYSSNWPHPVSCWLIRFVLS